jgi:integrase
VRQVEHGRQDGIGTSAPQGLDLAGLICKTDRRDTRRLTGLDISRLVTYEDAGCRGDARDWYPLRVLAGLGEMRFHDLRHSCVTLLLRLGVPPHIVQAIVGHADVQVTMAIYAHASLEDQRKALDQLAESVAG